MSLMSFIENAGEKLIGKAAPPPPASPPPAQKPDVAALNAKAGEAIAKYVQSQNLSVQSLDVRYDGATKTVTVSGVVPDQATKEKVVLCCGNVAAVAKVDDQLSVAQPSAQTSAFYEVKSGDTLSKIAEAVYGDSKAYMRIFEANRPMLSDPNRIYPGQKLRVPPKAT
ncbi:MAG TPA: peptidoglycan-binding protein LysM [Steroidobacteraceae bacterium]|nr:peptidoglycan-binding protein LysM [Steroidobacteraceae bacterium]